MLAIRVTNLFVKLRLHGAIYCHDSFAMTLHYCANLKAIRCESTSLNRIVDDKSHCVIVAKSSRNLSRSKVVQFEFSYIVKCHTHSKCFFMYYVDIFDKT